mmetsp:Transcript_44235/g.139557  ORF Transcript_44235/g.139557 Transcript_44235/m.139557 type:complete len:243 (-) Transcript_44235:68-796(-)
MTLAWDDNSVGHPLTLIHIPDNQVIQVKTPQNEGYTGLQIGAVNQLAKRMPKSLLLHFQKHSVVPKKKVHEFRVTEDALLETGTCLTASHLVAGQYVDITGKSIGKGFQGAMKRWGFGGQGASHGASRSHRSLGSTGHRKSPGRTFKNKKMHGHMGNKQVTVLGLLVYAVDPLNNLIAVRGSVPGSKEGYVFIRDAIRMHHWKHNQALKLPIPTAPESLEPPPAEVRVTPTKFLKNPFEGEA